MANLIFEVGILNKYEDTIDEVTIYADNEAEMWEIFDWDILPNYPEYDNAVIYDSYLA